MREIKEEDVHVFLRSSESAENSCKKKINASMFIPSCCKRPFEFENQYVGKASPSQSVKENPSVAITMFPLLTKKDIKEKVMAKRFDEREYPLCSGPLGMCNNPYCMTCPAYSRDKKKEMLEKNNREKTQHSVNRKIHENQDKPTRKLLLYIHQVIHGVVNPHSTFANWWERVFLISCLLATFVDPLFFFLLSVEKGNKCVVFDWTMAWVIVVLRSVTDLVYLLNMLLQFKLAYITHEHRVVGTGILVVQPKRIFLHYLRRFFWIDLFVVLPLPQVLTMLVRTTVLFPGANDARSVLRFVVFFQYLPRLHRFLPMLAGRSPNGFIFETAWANFVINLLSFILAGHIVGSCWYLFGLQRVNQCLKDACESSHFSLCKKLIDCGHVSGKDAFSSIKKPDQWKNNTQAISCFSGEGFRYGIYLQAVNLTTEHNVVTRYMYSLFWGFQQISTLAGNQIPSYYTWEVLFTMAIVGFGLLLFALLIGNMQNFLQALGKRRLDMMLRRRDVDQWMSHRHLPDELKEKVRKVEQYNWMVTRGVDEEKIMNNLPEDLQQDIRRHLFQFLKKVRIFCTMDEPVLDAISMRLRQKTYIKGCQILFPSSPVKKMTFVVRGEMESVEEDGYAVHLSSGDVCGEELLTWFLQDSLGKQETAPRRSKGELPISKRTVKCVTNVEALVFGAADLEEIACVFSSFLQNPHVQRAVRFELPHTRDLAAKRIQAVWRNRKKRLNQPNNAGAAEHPSI